MHSCEPVNSRRSVGAAACLGKMGYTLPMRMPSLIFVIAVLLATGLEAVAAESPAPAKPPNIVLLIANDLGWVDVSSGRGNFGRGSRFHETPNIDRLAEQGASFSAAYTYQNTAPSRATLESGLNPVRHWVYSSSGLENAPPEQLLAGRIAAPPGNRTDLPATRMSLAEALTQAEYRTTFIGKLAALGPPARLKASHGFAQQLAVEYKQRVPGASKAQPYLAVRRKDQTWHFASPAFDRFAAPYSAEYVERHLAPLANGNDPAQLVGTPKHLTDAIADAALHVIAQEAQRPQPFFIEVAFHASGQPVRPRRDLRAKYAARPSGDLRHTNPGYAAFVEGLDQAIGRILAGLDDPNADGDSSDGIRDDTLVVLISDGGGLAKSTSNAPLRGGNGSFLEGGLRVPWIMRLPGTIPAASSFDEPVQIADLYPTFAELAGVSLPGPQTLPLDGESLLPLLRGEEKQLDRPAIFWHFPGYSGEELTPLSSINRRHDKRRYKLSWSYESLSYSLYDVTNDVGEGEDLLTGNIREQHAVAAERLSRDLHNWVRALRAPRGWVRARNVPVKPPPVYDAHPSQ